MQKVTQETLRVPEQRRGTAKSVLYKLQFTKRKAFCQLQLLTERGLWVSAFKTKFRYIGKRLLVLL